MKIFKLAVISIIILFLVVLGISLSIPSHIRISRAINVVAQREAVFNNISRIKNWKQWNELLNKPELSTGQYGDSDFISDKLKVHLMNASADSVITGWTQANGRIIHSGFAMIAVGDTTIVQWYFDFYPRWYPWEKISAILLDNQVGPAMEKSLGKLKKETEGH
jgi:hypothetical protein